MLPFILFISYLYIYIFIYLFFILFFILFYFFCNIRQILANLISQGVNPPLG